MKPRTILIMFMFVVSISLLWIVVGSVSCQLSPSYLSYRFGVSQTPPRCMVGRRVVFDRDPLVDCNFSLPIGQEDVNVEQFLRDVALPGLYQNLLQGCLDNVEWRNGEDVAAIRRRYMELLTVSSLRILCDQASICPGRRGYVNITANGSGNNRAWICLENFIDDYDPLFLGGAITSVLGHEIAHLALWPRDGWHAENDRMRQITGQCAPDPTR